MGIQTGGNINISGSGNVVDLNVTGPAIFNTDLWVGGNIYNANLISGKDGLFSGNLTVLGNLRYTNVSVVVTDNLQFRLANNQSNAALLDGGGWTLGANNQGTFLYNNASESWQTNLSLLPTANNVLNLGGPINHYNNLYVDNALIPGNLVAGAVSGTFTGDAGNLANIPAANVSGTVATANTVTNNAQPNITSTGILTTLTVSGNVYATNLFGNIIGIISNAVYANTAGNATTAATVTSNLQPNINMVGILTTLSVSGNAVTGNVLATGYVSSQGNVTAAYLFGNGSHLTGVLTTLSGNLQGNIWANGYYINNLPALSVNGNVTGNYFIGNGSQLTGLPAGYANADAQLYFASGTSNANISITGNVLTTAAVSATGNITGNFFIGNGSQLTGLPAGYANADAQAYFASGTSNANISITGNILTTANISATGNITGNYILGNGALLSGISSGGISNGTSNINIATANGNIAFTVANSQVGRLTTSNISLGSTAGLTDQGSAAVAIGLAAGRSSQGNISIAIGIGAGFDSQDDFSIAIGREAAMSLQGNSAIAVGQYAGKLSQGNSAIAIGNNAGMSVQGLQSVAIGANAGYFQQGVNAIAIGANAAFSLQGNNTIVLNATGNILNTPIDVVSATFIDPIRYTNVANVTGNVLVYNTTTKEINFTNIIAGGSSANISNGTSNVNIATTNGNVTIGVANTANVVTVTANLVSIAGNIVTTGNANLGNVNLSGNIVDTGALSVVTGSNGNITLAPNGTGNVLVTSNLSITGNIFTSSGQVLGVAASYGSYQVTGRSTAGVYNLTALSGTLPVVSSNKVLLAAGGTYELRAMIAIRCQFGAYNWQTEAGALIGLEGVSASMTSADPLASTLAYGVFTPSVDTFVQLELNNVGGFVNTDTGYGEVSIRQIAGQVPFSARTDIINGASNVNIATANANITMGVAGTANVVTVTATSASVTGNIVATGNASVGNVNLSGNIVDTGALSIVTGSNGNITLAPNGTGNVVVVGNLNITGGIASRGDIYGVNNLVMGSTGIEGAQIIMGWANVGSITGQVNGTWNVDVDANNVMRTFYQNLSGTTREMMRITPAGNTMTIGGNLSVSGTIRDDLGPVRSMLSGQTVLGDAGIAVTVGQSADIVSFTLPAAGTYLINYTARIGVTASAHYGTIFLATAANVPIDDTRVLTQYQVSAAFTDFQMTTSSSALITVTGSTTYKLRVVANTGTVTIISDGAGRSKVVWAQISA